MIKQVVFQCREKEQKDEVAQEAQQNNRQKVPRGEEQNMIIKTMIKHQKNDEIENGLSTQRTSNIETTSIKHNQHKYQQYQHSSLSELVLFMKDE